MSKEHSCFNNKLQMLTSKQGERPFAKQTFLVQPQLANAPSS
jgi:hypothetical protein